MIVMPISVIKKKERREREVGSTDQPTLIDFIDFCVGGTIRMGIVGVQ